jgi:phage FluMu protein Com
MRGLMENIRCGSCNRLLAKADFRQIEIKCPRCGTFNLKAKSLEPERPGASIRKETHHERQADLQQPGSITHHPLAGR